VFERSKACGESPSWPVSWGVCLAVGVVCCELLSLCGKFPAKWEFTGNGDDMAATDGVIGSVVPAFRKKFPRNVTGNTVMENRAWRA